MNRRDFLNKSILGLMAPYLAGNPLLLGADGGDSAEAYIVCAFMRGGYDQIVFGQPTDQETVNDIARFRSPITIKDGNSYPFDPTLAIPIDDGFVIPAFWEGLFSKNASGDIPASRIRAPKVSFGAEEVPLDELFAIRVIQNACNLNFAGNLNFSHAVMQLAALVMNTFFQSTPGTLSRVIYHGVDNPDQDPRRALFVGHAGFSSFEFGGPLPDVAGVQSNARLEHPRPLESFGKVGMIPVGACRGYNEASSQFRFNGDRIGDEYRMVQHLIKQLRSYDHQLAQMYNNAYEQLRAILSFRDVLSRFQFSADENAAFTTRRYQGNQIVQTQLRFSAFRTATAYFLNDQDFPEKIKFAGLTIGGWDHHSDLQRNLLDLVPELVAGIGGMIYTIARRNPLKLRKLIIYIFTEFGRTFRFNSARGTDHGNGNNICAIIGLPPGRRNRWIGRKREFNKVLGPRLQFRSGGLFGVPLSEYENIEVAPFSSEFSLGKISQQAGLFALMFKLLNIPENRIITDTTAPFIQLSHLSTQGRRLFNEVWQGLPQFET